MDEKRKLLLFDDDVSTADIMKDYLEDEFEVTWVSDKDELEGKIERDYYSVILVDVSIVGSAQPGYEIVGSIRKKYRVTTPIVVYSAVRNVDEIEKEMGGMFYSYVPKVGRGWQEKLLKECLKACNEPRRGVSAGVLAACFGKLGKLDLEIDSLEIPDGFVTSAGSDHKITIRSATKMLEDSDLDDSSWDLLHDTLWTKYDRLSDQKIINS